MRTTLALAAAAVMLLPAPTAHAANPWMSMRVLNMSHQGGEDEAPSNTMYAYRRSLELGADMLEIDVHATKDDRIVAMHDAKVDRTTNGTGEVYEKTLAEVQALDAAHYFAAGKGTEKGLGATAYPFRGVRTGSVKPPLGYRPEDFRIPSLAEILRAFPDVPINIEIKGRSDSDTGSFFHNADLLADVFRHDRRTNVIVVSFNQQAMDRFHQAAPHVPVAPGLTGTAAFFATGLNPGGNTVALQPPPQYEGLTIVTQDFVDRAHRAELAVHVWFSGQEESERVYNQMLDYGVDGLMPAKPSALEKVLCERRAPRLAGNPNHCGGGAAAAATNCRAAAGSLSRMSRAGVVKATVRRTGAANFACRGRMALTMRRRSFGRARTVTLGAGRFAFPWGVTTTTLELRLGASARALVRAGRRGVVGRATTRVDRQTRTRVRSLRLR